MKRLLFTREPRGTRDLSKQQDLFTMLAKWGCFDALSMHADDSSYACRLFVLVPRDERLSSFSSD